MGTLREKFNFYFSRVFAGIDKWGGRKHGIGLSFYEALGFS